MPLTAGVKNLVEKGYKKISPFFIPYAITNMGGALLAIDTGFMGPELSSAQPAPQQTTPLCPPPTTSVMVRPT